MDSPAANFARDRGWEVNPVMVDGETYYALTHASRGTSPSAAGDQTAEVTRQQVYKTEEAAWSMAAIRAGWTAATDAERARARAAAPKRLDPRGSRSFGNPKR